MGDNTFADDLEHGGGAVDVADGAHRVPQFGTLALISLMHFAFKLFDKSAVN